LKKEKLKIDLRNADKDDMITLARLMMSLNYLFTQNGYTIHIRRTQSSKQICGTEQMYIN